jgi:hypothetical protein
LLRNASAAIVLVFDHLTGRGTPRHVGTAVSTSRHAGRVRRKSAKPLLAQKNSAGLGLSYAGIVGSPRRRSIPAPPVDFTRTLFHVSRVASGKESKTMATLFVRHTVSSYEKWRKLYDSFAPVQKAHGVLAQSVYQSADNPNDVTVTHDFATLEAARAFTKSEELRKAMTEAGVVGAPTIWFAKKV